MSTGNDDFDPSKVGYDQCADDEGNTNNGPWGPGSGPNGSYCDLDIENNVWVEGVVDLSVNPPKRGICMLDTMTDTQVVYTIQHNPQSRCDLPKVTSNPALLELLNRVPLLSTQNPGDASQKRHNQKGLAYYNVFRGRPPAKTKGPDK